jgi:hydrogenase 3 maturation protease
VAEEIAALRIPGVVGIPAGAAPENSSGELRALAPSHVIIVDAADMGEAPGTVKLLDPSEAGGASFATHGLPLSVLAAYLTTEMGCKVIMIGVQPRSVGFGESLSPEAAAGIRVTVRALVDALRGL